MVRRSQDDAIRRYGDLVKLNGLGTRFIPRAQERRLLEDGVTKFDLSLDEARGVMRTIAEDKGYIFESESVRRIQQVLSRAAGRNGYISRAQFRRAQEVLRDISENTISETEARQQLKRLMAENGWRPRRAGLFRSRRWYRQIEA